MAEGAARGLRRGECLGQGGAEAAHRVPWGGDQLLGGGRGLEQVCVEVRGQSVPSRSPSSARYSLCLSCLICEVGTRTGACEDLTPQMASSEACSARWHGRLSPWHSAPRPAGQRGVAPRGWEPRRGLGLPGAQRGAHLLRSSRLFSPGARSVCGAAGVGSVCTVHLHGKHRAGAVKAHAGPGGCWDAALRREGLELGVLGIVSPSAN